jgi:hypothetical protein
MNEMDDLNVCPTDWELNREFLDAWKFSNVATSIKVSETDNFDWLADSDMKHFEYWWPVFKERFWSMTSFLEDVEKGCRCTFDFLLNELEE